MGERKITYTDRIDGLVDTEKMYEYLTYKELPLTEALVYHMVNDLDMEKSHVAEILNVSMSRVSHAYRSAFKKFNSSYHLQECH